MNTTNVILIGVVGVGAVGAYMYMKNKKAQDNLLSGSLPATTPSGTPLLATPPLVGNLSTTSDGVSPSDANLNLANATVLVGKRTVLQSVNRDNVARYKSAREGIVKIDKKLADLGYKLDSKGELVKI